MLVKCKCHGNKIDRDNAYKININGKNEYYCTEQEYTRIIKIKETKDKTFCLINDIFGYRVINTILFKEINEIQQSYPYSKICSYISDNMDSLNKFMSKTFSSEYAKIRYFTAILKNNLRDYKEKKEEIIKQNNIEMVEIKYSAPQKRKCIDDFLEELE